MLWHELWQSEDCDRVKGGILGSEGPRVKFWGLAVAPLRDRKVEHHL